MDGQYSDKVMDHFMNPRNVGELPDANGIGTVGNPVCGDIMRLYVKIENDRIADIKFKTFGCLPAKNDVVLRAGGWQDISIVSKGEDVLNSEGLNTKVVETYKRDYRGSLIEIMPFVSPFNSFSVTPNHPVLCVKRHWLKGAKRSYNKCDWLQIRDKEELQEIKPDYVQAKDLEKSDYLIFISNRIVKDFPQFTKDVMRLLGYYLAEGYITAEGGVVAFAFNKKERKVIEEVKSLLERQASKKAKERTRGNVTEAYICSRKLARFLHSYAGRLAKKKSLSREIIELPFEKQIEMIKTYLIGDGNYYRRRPKDSFTYRAKTASRNLAIQIQEILARGGKFASIREIYEKPTHIDGRKIKGSTMYLISFKLERKHNFVHSNGNYFLVPIKSIKRRYFEGPVYNFQVAFEPNSYLVRGFVVHNCGAAIATSSMVTEMVKGKTIRDALEISNRAVAEALGGLPPVKMHCSVLAEDALRAAIKDYLVKSGREKEFPEIRLKEEGQHEGHEGE